MFNPTIACISLTASLTSALNLTSELSSSSASAYVDTNLTPELPSSQSSEQQTAERPTGECLTEEAQAYQQDADCTKIWKAWNLQCQYEYTDECDQANDDVVYGVPEWAAAPKESCDSAYRYDSTDQVCNVAWQTFDQYCAWWGISDDDKMTCESAVAAYLDRQGIKKAQDEAEAAKKKEAKEEAVAAKKAQDEAADKAAADKVAADKAAADRLATNSITELDLTSSITLALSLASELAEELDLTSDIDLVTTPSPSELHLTEELVEKSTQLTSTLELAINQATWLDKAARLAALDFKKWEGLPPNDCCYFYYEYEFEAYSDDKPGKEYCIEDYQKGGRRTAWGDYLPWQDLYESETKYQKFYSFKCGKNVYMKIGGYAQDDEPLDYISTAGEVQNKDFGYYGDNIRGSVSWLWMDSYPVFIEGQDAIEGTDDYEGQDAIESKEVSAATLFDYEDCKGHSIALFEIDSESKVPQVSIKYEDDYFDYRQRQTDSVIVSDGVTLTISRLNNVTQNWEPSSVTVGKEVPECVTLIDKGKDGDEWDAVVTKTPPKPTILPIE